jgi:hypothetical protein
MTRAGHRQWKKWVTQPALTVNNQYLTTSKKQLPPTTTIKISRNSIAAKSTKNTIFLIFFRKSSDTGVKLDLEVEILAVTKQFLQA